MKSISIKMNKLITLNNLLSVFNDETYGHCNYFSITTDKQIIFRFNGHNAFISHIVYTRNDKSTLSLIKYEYNNILNKYFETKYKGYKQNIYSDKGFSKLLKNELRKQKLNKLVSCLKKEK